MSFSPPNQAQSAMVVAGDEETRVLLRGLLRLHRFRIVGEADGVSSALDRLREATPDTLVADSHLAEGTVEQLLREVRARHRSLHFVLVVHDATPPSFAPTEAPSVILHRPFRIQEFATAIRPAGA